MVPASVYCCVIPLTWSLAAAFNGHKPVIDIPSGILNVYKPGGITSNDACQIVKRTIRDGIRARYPMAVLPKIKVGHGGTLDMHAEGVLAIGIGRATKCLPYYLKGNKTYEATGVLGYETDTLDVHGRRVREASWDHVTDTALNEAIQLMHGVYRQLPPLYSSKRVQGKRLREYAIKNAPVEIKPCEVIIYEIARIPVKEKQLPYFGLRVTSSGGTYVRSLIRDIAYKLNTAAAMVSLVRVAKCDLSVTGSLMIDSLDYDTIVQNLRVPKMTF